MRKSAFVIAICITLFSCSSGNDSEITTDLIDNPNTASTATVDNEKVAIIEFEQEVIEFGEITQGEIIEKTFRFKNVGKSDLIISSAQGSCGCTVPEWPKEPIKPGEEGVMNVKFDSNGKQGKQNKTITLVANTIPNTTVVALKGDVLVPGKN